MGRLSEDNSKANETIWTNNCRESFQIPILLMPSFLHASFLHYTIDEALNYSL